MFQSQAKSVPNTIQTLFVAGTATGITHGQLIERFLARRDETAEAASSALVDRHGAMVLKVCGQLLGDVQAAEDAFQATFLILARKAGRIREPELLGPWLFGVARRVAREAKGRGSRSWRAHDLAAIEHGLPVTDPRPDLEVGRREEFEALHEELSRLPKVYLLPIVLCYFEGLTHEQAANRLRWPVGTVSVRLQRARKLLGDRLTRRGLAPVALLITAVSGSDAVAAAVPPALAASTIQAVCSRVTHHTLATEAAALAEGVLRAMFWDKTRVLALSVAAASLVVTGSIIGVFRAGGATQQTPQIPAEQKTTESDSPNKPVPIVAPAAPLPLSARTQARLAIARELRDTQFRLYRRGQANLESYLLWQKRYTDLIASQANRESRDFDPIKLLEAEVKGFQDLEKSVKLSVENSRATQSDALAVEFFRLEAEEKLEQAKADREKRRRESQGDAPASSPAKAAVPDRR